MVFGAMAGKKQHWLTIVFAEANGGRGRAKGSEQGAFLVDLQSCKLVEPGTADNS
jgi:hypothetical protein